MVSLLYMSVSYAFSSIYSKLFCVMQGWNIKCYHLNYHLQL